MVAVKQPHSLKFKGMKMTNEIEVIELPPQQDPIGSVIWLHGLGADGNDFVPIVPELNLPNSLPLRFIFPHAPIRPITINGGIHMRAWYDILGLDRTAKEDQPAIHASQKIVEDLIEKELASGIRADKIVLAGFSQGGAIALQSGLRYKDKLAGIMALSTYLPLATTLEAEVSHANRDISIFYAHGSQDPLLPIAMAEDSKQYLETLNYKIEWHSYPMPHSVCAEEVHDISQWLQRIYNT